MGTRSCLEQELCTSFSNHKEDGDDPEQTLVQVIKPNFTFGYISKQSHKMWWGGKECGEDWLQFGKDQHQLIALSFGKGIGKLTSWLYKVHDFINDISSIEGQICQITYTLQQRGSLSHRTEREGKKKERKTNSNRPMQQWWRYCWSMLSCNGILSITCLRLSKISGKEVLI